MNGPQPSSLQDTDWKVLLERIKRGKCTPFLGGEANMGSIPPSSTIARELAVESGYPMEDSDNLPHVAQFIATTADPFRPREMIVERYEKAPRPDFNARDEPHRMLAELPLPVYVTTDYDSNMTNALGTLATKDPRRELCRWWGDSRDQPSIFDSGYEPTVANPVVFHMHGHIDTPESMLVTEDDYLDFLAVSREPKVIPPRIERAFTEAWLLFLGYRLDDLEFRVLLRSLLTSLKNNRYKKHVSVHLVQMPETAGEAERAQGKLAREYLASYCKGAPLNTLVYWGSPREFVVELRQRWEAFENAGAG
jgi:hypothetical protein